MLDIRTPLALLLTALLIATAGSAAGSTYEIEPDKSRIRFQVGHHDYAKPVKGRFGSVEGRIEYDSSAPESLAVDVAIDPNSIDTENSFRDAHLRSSFFETERFPTIEFTAKTIRADGKAIEGELTMKGVRLPLVLEISNPRETTEASGDRVLRCRAVARLNRRDFGVAEDADRAEGLGKILANIQEGLDEFIEDEVEVSIFVVARERTPVVAQGKTTVAE